MHEYDGVPCVKSLFFNLTSGSKYKIQHDTWMLIQRTMLPIYILRVVVEPLSSWIVNTSPLKTTT